MLVKIAYSRILIFFVFWIEHWGLLDWIGV